MGATNGDLQNGRMLWDIMGPRFEIGWIYRDYGWYSEFMPLFLLFHQHFCFAIVASWTDDCCRVFTFFQMSAGGDVDDFCRGLENHDVVLDGE